MDGNGDGTPVGTGDGDAVDGAGVGAGVGRGDGAGVGIGDGSFVGRGVGLSDLPRTTGSIFGEFQARLGPKTTPVVPHAVGDPKRRAEREAR